MVAATVPALPPTDEGWVTKRDMFTFLRCEFTFWALHSGILKRPDTIDSLGARLIDEGRRFERTVLQHARPAPDASFTDLLASDLRLVGLPLIENSALRLRGIPDGILAEQGAVIPVEIKAHRDVKHSDELELAFYWRLLQPYRIRDVEPRGLLILRQVGDPAEIEVSITPELLAEVDDLVERIRRCRREGARARVCRCPACSGPLKSYVDEAAREAKDNTLIVGVGFVYAPALEAIGIPDYNALAACDPVAVAAAIKGPGRSVSARMVRMWATHARAYQENRIVFVEPPLAIDDAIILDLEYDVGTIWVVGVHLMQRGQVVAEHAWWADDRDQERRALTSLLELLAAHPEVPVITWGGRSADLPMLRGALARHGLRGYQDLERRHVDGYAHAERAWRAPIPELSLKAVARFLGVSRASSISDGLEAQQLYLERARSKDPVRREEIRQTLLAYNRDDLVATRHVLATLRMFADGELPA